QAEGGDPLRRPPGCARRGRPRARAREGGGRVGLRAGLGVIGRIAIALAVAALVVAPARAQGLGDLERRAKSFYDLLERGQKEQAAAVFPDLEKALDTEYQRLQDQMDRMRDDVMERDGDVEGLYRESRWREP